MGKAPIMAFKAFISAPRTGRVTVALLPVSQTADLNLDQVGELRLRRTGRRAYRTLSASTLNTREGVRSPRAISSITCTLTSSSSKKRFLFLAIPLLQNPAKDGLLAHSQRHWWEQRIVSCPFPKDIPGSKPELLRK
ncbi:MAG: hypothetical protein ISP90_13810 [Nevskia sp.]|nr:hypothetical protein [Nevskia sp.]